MSIDGGSAERASEIQDRVLASYQPDFYRALRQEQVFAYCSDDTDTEGPLMFGQVMVWPDLSVGVHKVGRSRKSLKVATKLLSDFMSMEPEPNFPGLDPVAEEIRKAYWRTVWGERGDGIAGIGDAARSAWLDGLLHGAGFCEIGLQTNYRTKRQRVTGGHVPITQVIWDLTVTDPRRSPWVAVVKLLPYWQAVARYGEEHVKKHKQTYRRGTGRDYEAVMVCDYWDCGLGSDEPWSATFVGTLDNKPMANRRNEFGAIPGAFMRHTMLSGVGRPMGQVAMQQSAERLMNRILDMVLDRTKQGPGAWWMNPSLLTQESQEALRRGEFSKILEMAGPDMANPPVGYVPLPAIDSALMQLWDKAEQMHDEHGVARTEAGQLAAREKTKYEVQQAMAQARQGRGNLAHQTLVYLRDLMRVTFAIARDFDRDPFLAHVYGEAVQMNGESPTSSLGYAFKEDAEIHLGTAALTNEDDAAKRMAAQEQLASIEPYAQSGHLNFKRFLEEKLRNAGFTDVEQWMEAEPQGVDPAQAGSAAGQQDPAAAMAAMLGQTSLGQGGIPA